MSQHNRVSDMKHLILLLILTVFLSCKENVSVERDNPVVDIDNYTQTEKENPEVDEIDESDETEVDADSDFENPDVDMYCPLAINANYPYFREDGTIHFCRPCDTPDEYDPQCVKSLWKDLNKEVYDKYKAGEFEDNEYVVECYPWPCEWKVEPTPNGLVPLTAHQKCDTFLNPRTWANDFTGSTRASNMDDGKIAMQLYNYRYSDVNLETTDGYSGKRTVFYDIESGKYIVMGKSLFPFYANGHIIIDPYFTVNGRHYSVLVDVVPYKNSYKYEVILTDEDTSVLLDSSPFITDKWAIMSVNHLDDEEDPMGAGTRELIYSKTGEWNWTTLAHENSDGKAGELSIAGDKAMFYHYGTDTSWICDLSKNPKNITTDCKKIGKDGEIAGFPSFDKSNPNRIAYRPMADGIPRNRFRIMDISKDPWIVEKEFDIPTTEERYLKLQLAEFESNTMLYIESYLMDASGYQEDGKLCYYRIDKEKVYCSKPLEGQKSYGHGFPNFEGKYLFWQPSYKAGYMLRDMDCYCKEEGVCPFEE